MKIKNKIKEKARKLKQEIIYYAYKIPTTGLLPKLIILFTFGYALCLIDLIPDFIPVLGYVDDLIILPMLIALSIKLIPEEIIKEARNKAQNEHLLLKERWVFAILFIILWITIILWLFYL